MNKTLDSDYLHKKLTNEIIVKLFINLVCHRKWNILEGVMN